MDEVDLGEVLTKEAIQTLKKGQVLGFKQPDDSINYYKIKRINKRKGTVTSIPTKLYTETELREELNNAN